MAANEKHHYVPRFLLKEWHSPPANLLIKMGWEHGKFVALQRPATMCARLKGLYRLPGIDQPEIIESVFLQAIDNDASLVHQRMLSASQYLPEPRERLAWSRYLIAQLRRHPHFIRWLRGAGKNTYYTAVSQFRADQGGDLGEGFESWLSVVGKVEAESIGLLNVFTDLVNSQPINEAILAATWVVRRHAPIEIDYLIGDRPVLIGGRLDRSFLIAIPISPTAAFFAYNDPETGRRLDRETPRRMVKTVNRMMVEMALWHVFSTGHLQAGFVRKHLVLPDSIPNQGYSGHHG